MDGVIGRAAQAAIRTKPMGTRRLAGTAGNWLCSLTQAVIKWWEEEVEQKKGLKHWWLWRAGCCNQESTAGI